MSQKKCDFGHIFNAPSDKVVWQLKQLQEGLSGKGLCNKIRVFLFDY